MRVVLYYLVLLLLFPIFVIGYVLWVVQFAVGGKSGESQTAQAPLFARWLQHRHGTRLDEPAKQLMGVVPGIPWLPSRLVAEPLLLAHRISGYVPPSYAYPFEGDVTIQTQGLARQTFYDGVVKRYLPERSQFVILGAGFDTRAFQLSQDGRVRSFEVDTPQTSAVKRDALAKAGVQRRDVALVAADFEKDDWLVRLVEAGFDPTQSALFIWEGVTPYLEREAVVDTLHKIAGTATGSVVAFDYFTTDVLESNALLMRFIRTSLKAGGESLKFGVDSTPPTRDRVADLLQSCGLTLVDQQTAGQETNGKRAWGGFAVAIVE